MVTGQPTLTSIQLGTNVLNFDAGHEWPPR
jgi:hypothetical protein